MCHMGYPVQLYFEGDRDLLLDFFRRVTWPLADDLGIGVGDVGISLNREIVERDNAPDKQHQRQTEHQNAISQGKVDDITDHLPCPATAVENASALATTSSPGFTSSLSSCIPSGTGPSACTSMRRNLCGPSLRKIQSLSCSR